MSENLLMLAHMAETWHCRPSEFFRGLPEVTAFQIDAAAVVWLAKSRPAAPLPTAEEDVGTHIYL